MQLPGDFATLTVPQQLLVLSNLERVDRGLAPVIGLSGPLDQDALTGAQNDADPVPSNPNDGSFSSNWEGGYGSPFEADFVWMYDDGFGSNNEDCTSPGDPGCWGHRHDILEPFPPPVVMGAADAQGQFGASQTELFVFNDGQSAPGRADAPLAPTWATIAATLPFAVSPGSLQLRAHPHHGPGHRLGVRGEHEHRGDAVRRRRRVVGHAGDLHRRGGLELHLYRLGGARRHRHRRHPHPPGAQRRPAADAGQAGRGHPPRGDQPAHDHRRHRGHHHRHAAATGRGRCARTGRRSRCAWGHADRACHLVGRGTASFRVSPQADARYWLVLCQQLRAQRHLGGAHRPSGGAEDHLRLSRTARWSRGPDRHAADGTSHACLRSTGACNSSASGAGQCTHCLGAREPRPYSGASTFVIRHPPGGHAIPGAAPGHGHPCSRDLRNEDAARAMIELPCAADIRCIETVTEYDL